MNKTVTDLLNLSKESNFKELIEKKGYKVVEIPNNNDYLYSQGYNAFTKDCNGKLIYDFTKRYNLNDIQVVFDFDKEEVKILNYLELYTKKEIKTFVNDLKSCSGLKVKFRNKII